MAAAGWQRARDVAEVDRSQQEEGRTVGRRIQVADCQRAVGRRGQTLDPTHSGIASFDLALTGLKQNTLVLLCAVIRAGTSAADDIALTAKPLKELALTSPNVAVRSIRIVP
jgi:hypothetical protein